MVFHTLPVFSIVMPSSSWQDFTVAGTMNW